MEGLQQSEVKNWLNLGLDQCNLPVSVWPQDQTKAAWNHFQNWSRKPEYRVVLAQYLGEFLSVLSVHLELSYEARSYELLTSIFRSLRNLCVDPLLQNELGNIILKEQVQGEVLRCVRVFLEDASNYLAQSTTTLTACLQFLANLTTNNPKNQVSGWKILFPNTIVSTFAKLQTPQQEMALIPPLLMVVYNSILKNPVLRRQLASDSFMIKYLLAYLVPSSVSNFHSEWLDLIFINLLKHKLLSVILNTLSDAKEKLVVLKYVDDVLRDFARPDKEIEDEEEGEESLVGWAKVLDLEESGVFLVRLLHQLLGTVFHFERTENMWEKEEVYMILEIFETLSGAMKEPNEMRKVQSVFGNAGLLQVLLEVLASIDKNLPRQAGRVKEQLEEERGFENWKRKAVMIIANLCYKNKSNQDIVYDAGGMMVVLNQCRLDDRNPYIRESAIWAIRNLCEDNERNSKEVERLQPQGEAENEELKEMGLKLEFKGGKFTVKKADDTSNGNNSNDS